MDMKRRSTEPVDVGVLVDIRDINVNQNLPVADKIIEFITLSKNPYIYRYGDKVVRINFSLTNATFEDRMKGYFEMI
jgi:hypothetical protein